MAYAGYLMKLGGADGEVLPLDFIQGETYDVEPNRHRGPGDKYDITGLLHRTVSGHTSVRISFTTRGITNTSLAVLNGMIHAAMTDENKRDITVEYYDPETDSYKVANCYMPDPKYSIKKLEVNSVQYLPVGYEFIEY